MSSFQWPDCKSEISKKCGIQRSGITRRRIFAKKNQKKWYYPVILSHILLFRFDPGFLPLFLLFSVIPLFSILHILFSQTVNKHFKCKQIIPKGQITKRNSAFRTAADSVGSHGRNEPTLSEPYIPFDVKTRKSGITVLHLTAAKKEEKHASPSSVLMNRYLRQDAL